MTPHPVVPIVTFTTDFGLHDHYAGTMKGVVLGICPQARLIDITHDVPAFSTYAGAYAIDQAAPFFPAGTVHVVVVDPGVGTARKPLLLETSGQFFVGPDNGVLSLVRLRDANSKIREITNRQLWLPNPSSTFHGRDIFAAVAAALAGGTVRPDDVGPALPQMESLAELEPVKVAPEVWHGRLLSADRFGNLITNFKMSSVGTLACETFSLRIGNREICRFQKNFGEAGAHQCFAYPGSSGYVEVGMNRESAAYTLKAAPGDAVTLRLRDTSNSARVS
jgi:S-adenosyl-L-methionine hydrolase (adenosine-forming)